MLNSSDVLFQSEGVAVSDIPLKPISSDPVESIERDMIIMCMIVLKRSNVKINRSEDMDSIAQGTVMLCSDS